MPYYQYLTVQQARPGRISTALPKISAKNRSAAHPLFALQRCLGNRAIQRLIHSHQQDQRSMHLLGLQAKLMVGHPRNHYEQEADQIASRVMTMSAPVPSQTLQRAGMSEEQEEPLEQTKALGTSITPFGQRQSVKEEDQEQPFQAKHLSDTKTNTVQRASNPEKEDRLQMYLARAETSEADADVEKSVMQYQERGCCLPDGVRKYMEPRFGVDFSEVRVHQGRESANMNKALNAQAFTVGHNIFLGAGKAVGNSHLLAHELTHVVQQTGGKPTSLENKKEAQRPCLRCNANSRRQITGPTCSKKHSRQQQLSPFFLERARLANQTVWRSPAPTSNSCWSLRAKCYYHCTKKHLWRYPPDTKGFQICRKGCCDRAFYTCKKNGTWPCVFSGM